MLDWFVSWLLSLVLIGVFCRVVLRSSRFFPPLPLVVVDGVVSFFLFVVWGWHFF